MSVYNTYRRDSSHLQNVLSENNYLNINAMKSYIEADEAQLLLDIIGQNYKARIYCLISCFTILPAVKCIELLIAKGTPLNQTFEHNPFHCTPEEYIKTIFNSSIKSKSKSLNDINQAIKKGLHILNPPESIIININVNVSIHIKKSLFKKIGIILLLPINKIK